MHREEAAVVVFLELLLISEAENNALLDRPVDKCEKSLEIIWNICFRQES